MAEWKRVGQLGSQALAAGSRRTWGQWLTEKQRPLLNVGIGFFGCLMSGQILKMKYMNNELELQLAAARSELAHVRSRIADVEPLAARLKVDSNQLRTELSKFFFETNDNSLGTKIEESSTKAQKEGSGTQHIRFV